MTDSLLVSFQITEGLLLFFGLLVGGLTRCLPVCLQVVYDIFHIQLELIMLMISFVTLICFYSNKVVFVGLAKASRILDLLMYLDV